MKKANLKTYAFWILTAEAVGILSGLLSREGIRLFSANAAQPALSPRQWVFPVVWTILYALMGISAARIAITESRSGLNLFAAQLIVNFFWSLLFFNAGAYGFAALWLALLILLVVLMILAFGKADKTAAWLQLPYLLWLGFALYLNVGVWLLNR